MAVTVIQTLTDYTASSDANVHTCVSANGEILTAALTNESGAAITVTGLSVSTTSATQQSSGDIIAGGGKISIADGETKKYAVNMTTANEFLVLAASGNLSVNVSGVGLS
jgi:hypothetical protein